MTPRFQAWATEWMTVPSAEMGTQEEEQVWGERCRIRIVACQVTGARHSPSPGDSRCGHRLCQA